MEQRPSDCREESRAHQIDRGCRADGRRAGSAAEIACLETTIERLESDLPRMRQRANLWSLGDVAGLRTLPFPDEQAACYDALRSVPKLRGRFEAVKEQLRKLWIATAEQVLAANESSFAVLPIKELVDRGGLLDELRAKGYEAEEP